MKIVIVIGKAGLGGSERVALNLSKWFNQQERTHATVLALSKPTYNKYNLDGYDFVELHSKIPIWTLRKFVKQYKPDIVLSMGVPLCIFTVPALVGIKLKHVVSERNSPANFAGTTATRIVARLLMRFADGYVFQTKEAQEFYGGDIAKHSVIIHNPLFQFSEANPINRQLIYDEIVSVGRLNKQKNQKLIIEAFASVCHEFPSFVLKIYGDGPERENLQNLVNSMNLQKRVSLPGTTTDIFDKIKTASLFILSSNFEGMPNALMEAMSLGLPCISTDCPCGGPHEIIQDGVNGMLIPVDDKKALVKSLRRMLSNLELRNKIGSNAMQIRHTHSMDLICNQWYKYFSSLL